MGTFSGDFEGIAKSIADNLTRRMDSADELAVTTARYRRIRSTIETKVAKCLTAIVGSRSVRGKWFERGVRTYYYPDETGLVITVDSKALVRPSFAPDEHGHIMNIINVIGKGYSTGGKQPKGVWRNKKIRALPERKPYTRYNYSSGDKNYRAGEHGAKAITNTLDELLTDIQETLARNSIPANIILGDSFWDALLNKENPTRTTLSNASDQT